MRPDPKIRNGVSGCWKRLGILSKIWTTEFLTLPSQYFKRESRIWTALGAHSNIVPLLGFIPTAQTQAFPSLVMPYYRSGDLRHLVNETRVSLKVKIQLVRSVLLISKRHNLQNAIHERCEA